MVDRRKAEKRAPRRAPPRLRRGRGETSLSVDRHGLGQAKCQAAFGSETDIFFARTVSYASAASRAHSTADERAFTTTGQRADQGTRASAAANHLPIALLVRTAFQEDARGLHRQRFALDRNAGKG